MLVAHDKQDFGDFHGKQFYGLPIHTPGMFRTEQREHGRLRQHDDFVTGQASELVLMRL